MRKTTILFCLSLIGFACSSSSSGDGSSSSSGASGNNGPGRSNCSCSVEQDGVTETIACGQQACVAGTSYQCGDGARLAEAGSACTSASDGGKEGSASRATTVPCEYHDFDTNEDVTSCDAATEYCIRSYTQSLGPGSNNVCVPFPSGCADCDCASDDAEAAWKKAQNNTINCTGALLACADSNGAVVVDCIK